MQLPPSLITCYLQMTIVVGKISFAEGLTKGNAGPEYVSRG
jgi:hypothetical protein